MRRYAAKDKEIHPPRGKGGSHAASETEELFIFQYAKAAKIDPPYSN